MKNRDLLLARIDSFMEADKSLSDNHPAWNENGYKDELSAKWPIIERGGLSRSHLRFRYNRVTTGEPSISVIFDGYVCYRIDIKSVDICEPNPRMAELMGLPATVCGTHCHPWKGNREYIARLKGENWEMPVREQVSQNTKRIPQALAVLAGHVGIELTGPQRAFDIQRSSRLI